MEIIKQVSRWGNSAGILLPKEWLGNQVKIVLIDRTLEIKKEVLRILDPYLEDIIGIYLTGSYARGEQESYSDIDILVITKSIKKEITSGKYNLSLTTLEGIKKTLGSYPELVLPRLYESKVIMNSLLIEELKNTKINKNSFKKFIEETKRIIKITQEFIDLDKIEGDYLESKNIIYSIILRLRGIALIKSLLEQKNYSNKIFKKQLLQVLEEKEYEDSYAIYKAIKDKKKEKIKLKIETGEKLLNFLKKQIKTLE